MAKILDQASSTTRFTVWQGTYEVSLAGNIRIFETEHEINTNNPVLMTKRICV